MHHEGEDTTFNHLMGLMGFQEQHSQQIEVAPPVVYVEQQNAMGKFIPNLLLHSQLQHSTDHEGNTLLHHMCSYNSPYLQMYISSLPQNHAHFNQPNFNGIRVLDLAATYCPKHIFEKLKAKGASQSTLGTDYWAIRGANLDCWSGSVPVQVKQLIHWAAYNDLPQVLYEYQRQGANLDLPDNNGTTPIDTALINKSYRSFEYLLSLGFSLTNQEKLKDVDSFSMTRMYMKQKHGKFKNTIDPFLILAGILSAWFLLIPTYFYFSIIVFILYLFGRFKTFQPLANLQNQRVYSFHSKFLKNQYYYGKSHIFYITFLVVFLSCNSTVLSLCLVSNYFQALLYLFLVGVQIFLIAGIFVQLYGIFKNLTNSEMFSSHKHEHLYQPISVVASKKIAVRSYRNPYDLGITQNIKQYLNLI